MLNHKLLLPFLALPFIVFALMIADGVIAGFAPRFVLPVQGFDPRELLYGHYMNLRIQQDYVKNIEQQGCGCIKPSASKEKIGVQNAVLYMSCKEVRQQSCMAILDGSDRKLMKSLSDPFQMYIEENLAPELEETLRKEPQRLEVEISLRSGTLIFHQLLLDGKPIKSKSKAAESSFCC